MKNNYLATALVALMVTTVATGSETKSTSDAEIKKILADRIDVQKKGVGIVVGIIEPSGKRFIAHGVRAVDDKTAVDADTLFEIGSATKVFTALLLADAAARGDVSLDDPASRYLPQEVTVPKLGARPITLTDLATHTSGLPRLPSNLSPANVNDPYADYSVAQLYDFLRGHTLSREPGAEYEYSNLGVGLLGHILALRAGSSYEALVKKRITQPLGMSSTAVTLSPALQKRLARGHDEAGKPAANWNIPTLAGAGALRSSARDLQTFLAALLGYQPTKLSTAMKSLLSINRPTTSPSLRIALGWHILTTPSGKEIVWHNGGTGGYRSFIGYDPKSRKGVVVLSNMSTAAGVDDIGRHLLDKEMPLVEAPKVRTEVTVDADVLQRYVGRYELAPEFSLTISREEGKLFAQATGQPKFELFAEKQNAFFLKVVDAQLTFHSDESGKVTGLTLHQNGANVPGKRVE